MKPKVLLVALALVSHPVAAADAGLAYVSITAGTPHIHVRDSKGVTTRITSGPVAHQEPAWSPDGTRIAFTALRDGRPKIHIARSDGSMPRRLGSEDFIESGPAWSPDGHAMAYFATHPGAGSELRVRDLRDGSEVVVAGNGLPKGPGRPSWSADGRRLAFAGIESGSRTEIWVVERDGSDLRMVSGAFNNRKKIQPAMSPDGTKVAYVADTRPSVDVIVTDIGTRESRNVTQAAGAHKHETPSWSPDGGLLAFAGTRDDPEATRMDIFVSRPDGTQMRNLTTHPHEDYDPQWTHDGKSIVFTSLRTGAAQIHSVDLESLTTRRLAVSASHDMDAVPRPASTPLRTAGARNASQPGR